MAEAIAFRKKIVVSANRPVSVQIGRAQRGQWVFISGMNARVVNKTKDSVVLLRYDRRERKTDILTYK